MPNYPAMSAPSDVRIPDVHVPDAHVSDVHVNVAESATRIGKGIMSAVGLGSCVALMLYDRAARVGAMAHILLPHEALSRVPGGAAKYGSSAVPHLLQSMRALAVIGAPVASLVGGASMFATLLKVGGINMGERNVDAVRRALAIAGIAIEAEDVGGEYGRSIFFDVATGQVRVVSIQHGERIL